MQTNLENLSVSTSNSGSTENESSASRENLSEERASYRNPSNMNGSVNTSTISSLTPTIATTFQQIRVNIKCARFTPNGGLFNTKGDIYVEMIIDGSPSRKTEIAKKTWTPVWNENFDILITPLSRKFTFMLLTCVIKRIATGECNNLYLTK